MGEPATVRDARPADAAAIAAIYNHYIEHTVVTFEEVPVSADEMAGRVAATAESFFWLVAEVGGEVTGYAYAAPWHKRAAYRHSVETSVYLAHDRFGQGLGTLLYRELIDRLSGRDVHVAIGGVTLPNGASVALHEKFGYTKVAHYHEVGRKFGRWLDVGYWQITLPNADPDA